MKWYMTWVAIAGLNIGIILYGAAVVLPQVMLQSLAIYTGKEL